MNGRTASAQDNRLFLKGGDNPCQGYVQVYHEKKWGVVGSDGWRKENEDVVCRSIGCGSSLGSTNQPLDTEAMALVWLNDLHCSGSEEQLWECKTPGWGISIYTKDIVKKIKCSEEVKLHLDGYDCAGAVYYSVNNSTGYFCEDSKWSKPT
ncbi:Scavenger receptor cysteine-rich type 1 protein M160 [Merluccius polli]|uniref:Scavenger receptor cysteine-rich type 1 protein M160 n=1 Tax=Merluccius polli TaxID=89951 RepID=A0AA47P2H5_MERPO|nr:Scavenger receptor cysteine-rich type 1 protein M160 [Merluccius polli]